MNRGHHRGVTDTDVLIVGAGPAGSATAAWSARRGLDTLLIDAAEFPRDKPCGDGLTPRAVEELNRLGLTDWLNTKPRNLGLRAAGFGHTLQLPWPGGSLPDHGSAVPRLELDDRIRGVALDSGAKARDGLRAIDVTMNGDRVSGVVVKTPAGTETITCKRLVIADGARSQLGRRMGRQWHQGTAYGVAARAYIDSGRSDDEWISSHLELRGTDNRLLSGYGWIFPLADGQVNIGVGTLATNKRPADINLRQLLAHYTDLQRDDWQLAGDLRAPWSALLPMGGAVSNVAGSNWLMVGDAAGCVNPLNGEGIDYGLETGHLAAEVFASRASSYDLSELWPQLLLKRYGTAFSIARRLAGLITLPGFLPTFGPVGMSSQFLMTIALRVMGNLVTEADADTVARLWRLAGKASIQLDDRPPFS